MSEKRELELGDNLMLFLVVLMALATCTAGHALDRHAKTECIRAGHHPKDCWF